MKTPPFASQRFMADPYPFYKQMRAEGPVHRAKVAYWLPAMWMITRYEDVVRVLRDERFSKNYMKKFPWLPPSIRPLYRNLLTIDPPDHTRLRALVQRAFTPRFIEQLREHVQRVADDLLDKAARNSRMDLVQQFALPLPLTVIEDVLGIPNEDRRRFGPWAKRIAYAAASVRLTDHLLALRGGWKFAQYLRDLIARRRDEPKDDLITALIRAEEAGDKLTEDELVSMLILLLVAGYETTVHLISTGTLTLLQHPEQRRRLQEKPELVESAVEEILRYASPVQFSTPRVSREEITVGSVTIPADALVAAALGSANHDESQFPNPETFDIAREPNKHVAFGLGSHFCVGAPLARLEGQIAFSTLFRRFPNLHLMEPVESLRWRKSLAARGLQRLPVAG